MSKKEHPANTIVIELDQRAMRFRDASGRLVRVVFTDRGDNAEDLFRLCTVIAIAQSACHENDQSTAWNGANEQFFDVLGDRFELGIRYKSMPVFWSHLTVDKGRKGEYRKVQVEGNGAGDERVYMSELFNAIPNAGYVLGPVTRFGKRRRSLCAIQFEGKGPVFERLEKDVLAAVRVAHLFDEPREGRQFVEVFDRTSGSGYELKDLLGKAQESVFIVGQNLYSLVSSELDKKKKPAEGDRTPRQRIKEWLMVPGHTKVELLIVDPRSPAVLDYAMIFTKRFVRDLCDVIPVFKAWQEQIEGIEIKVTCTVPLSITAIDGKSDSGHTSLMSVTPLAFNEISEMRPTVILRRTDARGMFDDYYTTYHRRFEEKDIRITRSILDVSDQDIALCRSRLQELRDLPDPKVVG
jgi:hypothetical protein